MALVEKGTDEFVVSGNPTPSSSEQEQKPRDSPWIRYRVNYRNEKTSELIYETFGDQASTLLVQSTSAGEGTPSFEVIKLLYTYQDKEAKESSASRGTTPPPVTNSIPPRYSIRIHSPAIINAIHSVVKYYPGVNLTETPLTLNYPYMILCHHYDELERFAVTCQERDPSTACELEKGADVPISLLLRYLDGCVMPQVRAEQERLRRGRYTWQWEWVGLQPGRTVMQSTRERDEWDALVVDRVTGGPFPTDTQPASNEWTVYYWALDFNGVHLGRVRQCATSASWDGEELLGDNMVYLNFAGDTTEPMHPLAQEAVRLGRLYWEMVESKCQWHAGKGVDFPHNEVSIQEPEYRAQTMQMAWVTRT